MSTYENFLTTIHDNYIILEKYIGKEDFIRIEKSNKKIIIDCNCFTGSTIKHVDLDNISELRIGAFINSNIEEVNLSKNIVEIPRLCFGNCKNLKKINLENVKTIVDFAFNDCSALEEADLKNCNFIGAYGFSKCENASFKNLENVEFINEMALNKCKMDFITLNKIITIKEKAFKDCEIFSLKINNECDIDKSAFYDAKITKLILSKKPNFYPYTMDEKKEKLSNICVYSNFKDIEYKVPKIIYKETIDSLLNKGFNINQVNQIIKAYDKDIYMSEISSETSADLLRTIRMNYDKLPFFYQTMINERTNNN